MAKKDKILEPERIFQQIEYRWQCVRRHPAYLDFWRRLREHQRQDHNHLKADDIYCPGDPTLWGNQDAQALDQ